MDGEVEAFLKWAEDHRWTVLRHTTDAELPAVVLSRYGRVPQPYLWFLRATALLATPDETGWFNCKSDFEGASDSAFKWNELEIISLQAARDDEGWKQRVTQFWDTHLPVFISVKSGYAFYAIDTGNGAVVYGYEPEFEEVEAVASSFLEFLAFIMTGQVKI